MSGTGYQDPSCFKTAVCSKCEGHKTWNYWYHLDESLCDDCYYIGGKYKDLTKEEAMMLEAIDSFDGSSDVDIRIKEAIDMYKSRDYKGFIIFVDSLYGWNEDELRRDGYTKEEAIRCMRVLGGKSIVESLDIMK